MKFIITTLIIDLLTGISSLMTQRDYTKIYISKTPFARDTLKKVNSLQYLNKLDYFEILLDDSEPIILRSMEKCGTAYTMHLATGEVYFISCSEVKKDKSLKDIANNTRPIRWSRLLEKSDLLISGKLGRQSIYDVYSKADLTALMGKYIQREVEFDRRIYHLACYLPDSTPKDINYIFKIMNSFKVNHREKSFRKHKNILSQKKTR